MNKNKDRLHTHKYKVPLKAIVGSLINELLDDYSIYLSDADIDTLKQIEIKEWKRLAERLGSDANNKYSLLIIAFRILEKEQLK